MLVLTIVYTTRDAKYPYWDFTLGSNLVFFICTIVFFLSSIALLRIVSEVDNGYIVTKEKERGIDD